MPCIWNHDMWGKTRVNVHCAICDRKPIKMLKESYILIRSGEFFILQKFPFMEWMGFCDINTHNAWVPILAYLMLALQRNRDQRFLMICLGLIKWEMSFILPWLASQRKLFVLFLGVQLFSFFLFFYWGKVSYSLGCPRTHHVAKGSTEFPIILPPPPKDTIQLSLWGARHQF